MGRRELQGDQLANIRAGQRVKIELDTFGAATLAGARESIQPGTGARFSLLPPGQRERQLHKVTQRVPCGSSDRRSPAASSCGRA